MAIDAPIACAKYGLKNNLLQKDGWKRLQTVAKKMNKMLESVNKAKIQSVQQKPKFKYGVKIPRGYNKAVIFDKDNDNKLWQEAIALEMEHMESFTVFKDIGKHTLPPEGYKNIPVHTIFDVIHDERHQARLVADGRLTDIPVDSIYSGVVSLCGFIILLFLLN